MTRFIDEIKNSAITFALNDVTAKVWR